MSNTSITLLKKVRGLLADREFLNVATCDLHHRPNAVPKFFLTMPGAAGIYLIDYTWGRTWENLKVNPRVSLSLVDTETLHGYQMNGTAEILSTGLEYDTVAKELLQKEVDLSAKRIIEGVARGKKHRAFELSLPDKFVIFKVKITEIVEIGPAGDLLRENV
jgi:predicted pyridoxine 5'-phosphate oxidase superfamily flavin-nucleotide-binding protein